MKSVIATLFQSIAQTAVDGAIRGAMYRATSNETYLDNMELTLQNIERAISTIRTALKEPK